MKNTQKIGSVIAILVCLSAMPTTEAREHTTTLIRDRINWQEFLARHDLIWDRPASSYFDAPFVGNGVIGAMFYRTGQHTMRLDIGRTDVTDHRGGPEEACVLKGRLPVGHFTLRTSGTIRGGSMRLSLFNADVTGVIETSRGRILWRLLTHATVPVIIMEISPDEAESDCIWRWNPAISVVPRKTSPERTNPPPQRRNEGGVFLCVQSRTAGGDYSTAWQEKQADQTTRRLIITIADHYPAGSSAEEAVAVVRRAVAADFGAMLKTHRRWWRDYYPASFISIPHTQMEGYYWIQMYKLGSSIRKGGPLCDLMGPWYRTTRWPAIWWNLNTQMLFWPLYGANRLEMARNLSDTLKRNRDNLIANVPEEYRHDSAGISRCTGTDLLERYDRWQERANLIWTCHNLWWQYRCSMDEMFLREELYPLLRRAVNLYLHIITKDGRGRYHTPYSHSPEAFDSIDTNYDLASLRWGCRTLLEICRRLEIDDELIPKWKDVLENLVDYAVDDTGFMGSPDSPAPQGHRHWCHLIMIYPYYLVNWDQPENRSLIERSWRHWSLPSVPNAWSQAVMSSMASSMGRGEDALRHMNLALASPFLVANTMNIECINVATGQGYPCSETYGGMCQMVQDMLIQSWGDRIRVFPAIPETWKDVVFHQLRAEGAFLISARRCGGQTRWIWIKSLAGEPCRIQPNLHGKINARSPAKRRVDFRTLGSGVYELKLARGEQALLYSGSEPPTPVVSPVPADPGKCNCYGVNPRNASLKRTR